MKKTPGFPTRQYAYSRSGPHIANLTATPALSLEPGKIFEFLLGKSTAPTVVSPADLAQRQHDPFAKLVLGQGRLPLTLRDLLKIIDAVAGPDSLPDQNSYLVADGGQIPWSAGTENIDRAMRFVVTRGIAGQTPALLVSTSSDFDSTETFLQVIGWDSTNGAFQFYERRTGSWVWAGSSWDALVAPTRGNGPFDSHVNGALNMKELKFPWINWHSMAATIDGAVAPNDPLRSEPLWQKRRGGEDFEMLVARPGIEQWTEARITKCISNGRLTRLPEFFRQILDTSTINLLTSATAMSSVAPGVSILLPLTFFLNSDELVNELGLDPGLTTRPSVDGGIYLDVLNQFDVALSDGTARFKGDTHFVFLYPEPAFEDNLILNKLRGLGIVSDKLAASMLMVDFCNPVFSNRRKALLAYVPADASVGATSDFPTQFVAAIQAATASTVADSPEREFLANWATPETTWKAAFSQRIAAFFAAVLPKLSDKSAFAKVFELAESRRREFRKRPLFEFQLTTPVTNIPMDAPLLEFTPTGEIRAKSAPITLTQFDPPGFLADVTGSDLKDWSDWISKQLDDARNTDGTTQGLLNDGPRLQFFNPLKLPPAADVVEQDITWIAFPRVVQISSVSDQQRWQTADGSRDVQDEYCEWSVERDPSSGKIVRVTFTSEGPEYWRFLAHHAPQTVMSLYQQHISPQVKQSDLFDSHGDYIERNCWNNSTHMGAMHLIQRNNTLGAEIELAAAATIVRLVNGNTLTSEQELIACSNYGNGDRNSDPHIGAQVNALARAKHDITLANPVGLYIADLSVIGWQTPDSSSAGDYWKITRGTTTKALRAVYEVPASKSFVVGDIKINGKPIEFGAQIVDFVTIKLTGLATRLGLSQVKPFDRCASVSRPARAMNFALFGQGVPRSHR